MSTPAPRPRVRLDRTEARKGDIVEVKAQIDHAMESGLRRDAAGAPVPRRILNRFVCTVAGNLVFAADLEPAVAANPFLQFKFRALESGPVVLTWTDDDGTTIVAQAAIRVV